VIRLDKDVTDPRLVKALAHPLRVRILAVLDEHVASPTELAEELHAPLGNVSYHVRTLLSLGLIELVKETPRRGSVEHHYSAVARPAISDQAWESVPDSVKRAMIGAALQQAGVYVNAAAAAGSFNRANAHLSRTPLELDDEGWHAVAEELLRFMERAQEIERDCAERLKDAPEDLTRGQLLMMLFEDPAGVEEEDAADPPDGDGVANHHLPGPPDGDYDFPTRTP
jgi:DNA-binding transcriptional ArsR family regulator